LKRRIKDLSVEKGHAWFIIEMLKTLHKNIEEFVGNEKMWSEDAEGKREKMAQKISSIAERIENMALISIEIARKLVIPIGKNTQKQEKKPTEEDIEEKQAERLAAAIELYMNEIGLAPEIKEALIKAAEKGYEEGREKKGLGKWMSRIAERWKTKTRKTKEKLKAIAIAAMMGLAWIADKIGITWIGEKMAATTGTSMSMALALWLTFGPMAPIVASLCRRIGRKMGKHTENLVQNLVNGMIVAIMTILGMIAMNTMLVATAPREKIQIGDETIELPNPWKSPLRNIVTFMAPAIIWIGAAAAISIVASGIIGKLRNPSKIKEIIKNDITPKEPELGAKDTIMKLGLIGAMIAGI